MLSIGVRGGARGGVCTGGATLKLVTRATSLGGPETLIEHRASVEGALSKAPENLLRISVGLEHPRGPDRGFRAGAAVGPRLSAQRRQSCNAEVEHSGLTRQP